MEGEEGDGGMDCISQHSPFPLFLTRALQFYPGYADSSYFHNERGFQSPTPHGDTVDVLLSDAPGIHGVCVRVCGHQCVFVSCMVCVCVCV